MSRARTPRQKVLFAGFGFIPVAFLFLPKEIDHLGRLEKRRATPYWPLPLQSAAAAGCDKPLSGINSRRRSSHQVASNSYISIRNYENDRQRERGLNSLNDAKFNPSLVPNRCKKPANCRFSAPSGRFFERDETGWLGD